MALPNAVAVKTDSYVPRSIGAGRALSNRELLSARLCSLDGSRAWARPLGTLKGVGRGIASAAQSLGISTVGDLLEHLPLRHDDYSKERRLTDLAIGEEATVLVEVESCRVRPTRRRNLKLLECRVSDGSSTVTAIWFNQDYLVEQLNAGRRVLIHGQLDRGKKGVSFKVKSHELIAGHNGSNDGLTAAIHTLGLVPVYAATEGLQPRRIRQMVWQAQSQRSRAADPLPVAVRLSANLPHRDDALAAAHFPESYDDAVSARRRLAFEELLLLQLAIGLRRLSRESAKAAPVSKRGRLVGQWIASLPFSLTGDQIDAMAEVDRQLESQRPMQTLLVGEVGSGKTVVALYSMLRAVESGGQAALMAPTETLADQHFRTVDLLTGGLERIALLTSSTPGARRREVLRALRSGSLCLLVGTHALIERDVHFHDLRVAVVDEQHRFGVRQRSRLDRKGRGDLVPHLLHMTATPIPRTLALTVYGDLDSLTLRELPKGRRDVKTWSVPEHKRGPAYRFIRERLREGRQCFIVCPLVEESEQLQARAATVECKRLAETELSRFEVGVIHGQMPAKEKRQAMEGFVRGSIDVLVATSVIEVGIDVPNATIMVIEEAERYGLSQLHQLRGRVGRSERESYCLLFADPRSEQARRRIDALVSTGDGFQLAELDLELRGEGEILGKRQSGLLDLRAASLPRDQELLTQARRAARALLDSDPNLDGPQNRPLRLAVERRFGPSDALAA